MRVTEIPHDELERAYSQIVANLSHATPDLVYKNYLRHGLSVARDPFSLPWSAAITEALRAGTPLSVIRIGDGEANILSYRMYGDVTALDRFVAYRSICDQADTFDTEEDWLLSLRELLRSSVAQADVVGVLGIWSPQERSVTPELVRQNLMRDPRAVVGQWRGIDFMLRLAQQGFLAGKSIASAHLYFGVIRILGELIANASRVLLLTDKIEVERDLRDRNPGKEIGVIPVGLGRRDEQAQRTAPDFLGRVDRALPSELRGCLCLVGAGPWAEIYCSWIKQRGGVAIDIGSGFDLLAGKMSRPIHRVIGKAALQCHGVPLV